MGPAWLDALGRASTYTDADPGASVERVETHLSWVFLVGRDVWKLKKPVDFGFLDFTSLLRRRAACEAELRVNRRLAPGVYLGLEAVVRRPDGSIRVGVPAAGERVLEWAVRMRRLPEAERADVLLAEGRFGFDEVERIAARLAAFHRAARCDAETARHGAPEAIARNVEENVAQTRDTLGELLSPAESAAIVGAQTTFLAENGPLFQARVAAGRVRDGHGDLRLEHVYLHGPEVLVLDGIEFNDRFRYGDVAADLAFLAMDLTAAARPDLAEHLLARYARDADDYDLYGVIDFYEAYRAWVRGKVMSFLAFDPSVADAARQRAKALARRYFLVALGAGCPRALSPRVIAVLGPVAAGKSTVAAALSRWLSAPVVDADRTRKAMLGVMPTTRLAEGSWQGAYDPRFTEAVYAEVLRRAEVVVESGRPVILDASFRARRFRAAAAEMAARQRVPFALVECTASRAVLEGRLRAREDAPGVVSDARVELLDAFLTAWEPVAPDEAGALLRLDTERPWPDIEADVRARFPGWPKPG